MKQPTMLQLNIQFQNVDDREVRSVNISLFPLISLGVSVNWTLEQPFKVNKQTRRLVKP